MDDDRNTGQGGNRIPEGELPPKHINNTTELLEISNHIKSIFALLEGLRLKSMFLRQRNAISLAKSKLAEFEEVDIFEVQKACEG